MTQPIQIPASRTFLIAMAQAAAIYQQQRQEILNAAVEDNPALRGATFDPSTGTWTLPERHG